MSDRWDTQHRDPLEDWGAAPHPSTTVQRPAAKKGRQTREREKYPSAGTMDVAPMQGVSMKTNGAPRSPMAAQAENMGRKRQRWERSAKGAARMKDIEQHTAEQSPTGSGIKPGMAYLLKGWDKSQDPGPRIYDRQLPGLEDPSAAPAFKSWDEHTPEEQSRIEMRMKAKTGATLDSMERSIGAQIDQSFLRAERHGTSKPAGMDFYTTGEPAEVLKRTAKEHNVPAGLVAAMHADNSPNTPFESRGRYPQDEMARAALRHVQGDNGPAWDAERPKGAQGMTGNYRKSVQRAQQVLDEGRSVSDTRPNTGGYGEGKTHGLGPKTAAYANSWLGSHPDQFVSDVHSGGGGAVPHLRSDKPRKVDAEGNFVRKPEFRDDPRPDSELIGDSAYVRDKSMRERAVETPGFHAMADEAARRASTARGLGRLRQTQAAQWGEERIQRGLWREEQAYPAQAPKREIEGQLPLFHDRRH